MRKFHLTAAIALSLAAFAVSAARDPAQDDGIPECSSVVLSNGDILTTCVDDNGATTQSVRARGSSGGF